MFDRTIGLDPRPAAPQSRATYRMRDGHRREYDASRDRGSTSFRERCRGALADVGIYGAVSVPRSRRGSLRRASLHHAAGRQRMDTRGARPRKPTATGPQRQSVQGPDSHAERRGRGPEAGRRAGNRSRPGDPVRPYPARRSRARHRHLSGLRPGERRRLLEQGATIRRVRLDGELKSTVARTDPSPRGCERWPTDRRRRAAPRSPGTRPAHRRARTRVLYPDAQIEYVDAEGRSGRVNIEVASGNYRAQGSIRAKVATPGSGCMPTARPPRACSARSAWATAEIAPPCEGRPTGIRPRSSSSPPPCNPGRSARG